MDYVVNQAYSISGSMESRQQKEGFCVKKTLGSYVHLHFGSNPKICDYFVRSCRDYMEQINGKDCDAK